MADLVETWLAEVMQACAERKGSEAAAGAAPEDLAQAEKALAMSVPPGWKAFLLRHDGYRLGPDDRIHSLAEALAGHRELAADDALKGLIPIMRSGDDRFALDPDASEDAEWPVVAINERGVERCATSFLRFLRVRLAVDGGAAQVPDVLQLVQMACERDPGHAEHWLDLAEAHLMDNHVELAETALRTGLASATPPSPSLCTALAGLRLETAGQAASVATLLDDALGLDPLSTRDEDARLDALAFGALLAHDAAQPEGVAAARAAMGEALPSSAAFWRLEVPAAAARNRVARAALALRVLAVLDPDDRDLARLSQLLDAKTGRETLATLWRAREALDAGKADEGARKARTAIQEAPELSLGHAFLAEAANALHQAGAVAAARRATELNPQLVDGWRELGEAHLEAGELADAEAAFRQVVTRDPSFAMGHARLAQALLAAGKPIQALDAIQIAADKGAEPYVVAAARGDIYAEMERHADAADAYDEALRFDPEDHFTLHQAALEHDRAGHTGRAAALFEQALSKENHGCPQTHVDYGDLLRRMGRIGDAVRQLRKAVAAAPSDPEWREALREAERELNAAPN